MLIPRLFPLSTVLLHSKRQKIPHTMKTKAYMYVDDYMTAQQYHSPTQ